MKRAPLPARSALACAAALTLTMGQVATNAAEIGYPNRPIRYVVGGSVGGGADILARAIGQKLVEQWGQQVIVDNRPGGGGIVASEIVAKSPADGYTLLMAFTYHVTNPSLYPKLSYDAVKDFAPITLIATIPNILVVHPSLAADSVPALVALAKAKQLSFASTGSGASTHLAGVLFGYMSGTKLLHVPYKGAGPAITGVMMGESVHVDHPQAAAVLDLANALYNQMLRLLAQAYGRAQSAVADKRKLVDAAMRVMGILRAVSEHLFSLPASAGYPGVNAGVSFTIFRATESFCKTNAEWRMLGERLGELSKGMRTVCAGVANLEAAAGQLEELSRNFSAI